MEILDYKKIVFGPDSIWRELPLILKTWEITLINNKPTIWVKEKLHISTEYSIFKRYRLLLKAEKNKDNNIHMEMFMRYLISLIMNYNIFFMNSNSWLSRQIAENVTFNK